MCCAVCEAHSFRDFFFFSISLYFFFTEERCSIYVTDGLSSFIFPTKKKRLTNFSAPICCSLFPPTVPLFLPLQGSIPKEMKKVSLFSPSPFFFLLREQGVSSLYYLRPLFFKVPKQIRFTLFAPPRSVNERGRF